ncbi:MAG: hypothetical protein Kow0037_22890 [Calditrichia bacterium]
MELKLQWQGKPGREGLFGAEWAIHTPEGSYAASTTVGLNTRPHHGLLVARMPGDSEPLLVLSHFQEEYISSKGSQPLYVVEYANAFHDAGMSAFRRFKLFPAPTFIYRVGNVQIHKTVLLLNSPLCLLVRYKVSGQPAKSDLLRVRPFFAFRPVSGKVQPQRFVTQDFFLESERQFRFLPYPDAPELFGAFSGATFESDPLWYYQFRYRKATTDNFYEDLLTPGYFEMKIRESREMLLAFSFQPQEPDQLREKFTEKVRRHWGFLKSTRKKGSLLNQLRGCLQSYLQTVPSAGDLYAASLPHRYIYLTAHFRILRLILRAGLSGDWGNPNKTNIVTLPKFNDLLNWLNNNHANIVADVLSPFEYIYFIYEYLNRYPDRRLLREVFSLVEQLTVALEKGKVNALKIERSGRAVIRKGHQDPLTGAAFKQPPAGNGLDILTVEWYVVNKIGGQLATLNGRSNSRFEKNADRTLQYFLEKINPPLENRIRHNPQSIPPVVVRMLTSPFALLKPSMAKQLFLIICQNYLKPNGLAFQSPVEAFAFNISDFLRASRLWFPAENSFTELFKRIRDNWYAEFASGILGQMQVRLEEGAPDLPQPASAVMIAELLFLLSQLSSKSRK